MTICVAAAVVVAVEDTGQMIENCSDSMQGDNCNVACRQPDVVEDTIVVHEIDRILSTISYVLDRDNSMDDVMDNRFLDLENDVDDVNAMEDVKERQ